MGEDVESNLCQDFRNTFLLCNLFCRESAREIVESSEINEISVNIVKEHVISHHAENTTKLGNIVRFTFYCKISS